MMIKKRSIKTSAIKGSAKGSQRKSSAAVKHDALNSDNYKKDLIESNSDDKYDKLFEQKLSEQYTEFRNLKEHTMQTKKFIRALFVIIVIIILALLLLTFS